MEVMLVSNRMKNLNPYIPGEQPKDRDYIKLNANENPYKPSPKVIDAAMNFVQNHSEKLGLYPDPDSNVLHQKIADMLNACGGVLCRAKVNSDGNVCPDEKDTLPFKVTADMIYTGNGSDEVLSFVFYAFFDSDKKFVMPQFTYSFYPVYAGFYNIPMDCVPLQADWKIDAKTMLDHAKQNNGGIIFANPNAPTGIALSRDEVRKMLETASKDHIFIVDEAYVDFGGESCISLLAEFNNLVIVRTFSKSLCGAGQRLGYIVANPELVNIVTTVKNSVNHFPLDAVAQVCGEAACDDVAYYVETSKKIAAERDKFLGFLKQHDFEVLPSKTNFVFAQHKTLSGEDLYQKIKAEGILIRHFSTAGIENFIRISIGDAQQMEKLCSAIEKILS